MKRSFAAFPILALLIGCDAGPPPPAAQPPGEAQAARVTAGKSQRKSLQRTTVQPSRIEAFEETPLYPKINGYVEELLVDIGDRVRKDDVLLKLWVPEMKDDLRQKEALLRQAEAEVRQAAAAVRASEAAVLTAVARVREVEAGIERAEAEYQKWKAEYSRVSELATGGSVTKKLVTETASQLGAADAARQEAKARVDSAEAALNQSRSNVDSAKADEGAAAARQGVAEANLARAKTLLAYADIRAPYDGIVTRRHAVTGDYVQPATGGDSQPLLVVCRADVVRTFVDVPELEAAMVDKGDAALVTLQALGGMEVVGKVTRTSWDLEPTNRSLRVEIDLPNEDLLLRPGMYALSSILLGERTDVLTLPVTAVVREGKETFCCLVIEGHIQRTPIELGLRSGKEVEVVSGLKGDETVVLLRPESFKEGEAVELLPAQQ
jgi:RND family efflux transporter MFP subunit